LLLDWPASQQVGTQLQVQQISATNTRIL